MDGGSIPHLYNRPMLGAVELLQKATNNCSTQCFIIKLVGRPALFVFGAVMNIIMIIVMLSWTPTVSTEWVVYILGAMWGLGDAVWQTQVFIMIMNFKI